MGYLGEVSKRSNLDILTVDTNAVSEGQDKGFVSLWLIVAVACIVVIAVLMPKNIAEVQVLWKERESWQSFKEIQGFLNSAGDEAKRLPVVFMFNQVGPGALPYPFDKVVLSEGTVLDYAIRFWFLGYADVRLLQVHHQQSPLVYRQFLINGKLVELTAKSASL